MSKSENRLSGGVEVTDELVERLAREAEDGYQTEQLRPRPRRGRPSMGSEAATLFQVRLDPALREALIRTAEQEQASPSEITRRALRAYLKVSDAQQWMRTSPPDAPLNFSIFSVDIVDFGAVAHDKDRTAVRQALYGMLRAAFEASEIPWASCLHVHRGDGVLTIAPPTIATTRLVDPLLWQLSTKLKRHNRRSKGSRQIQLRVALHVGPVGYDAAGAGGQALIDTARMLDAPAVRRGLAESGTHLAFIASSHVHDSVLRHRAGIADLAEHQRVRVRAKESDLAAWVYLADTANAADGVQR